jgi:hypothetical protein
MDTGLVVTTVTTVTLAFLGYIITYLKNIGLSRRSERLDRVNRQLRELYGPLFALTHASKTAWDAFRSVHRPGQDFWDEGDPPTEKDLEAWRLWVKTVFLPITSRMYELVITKSDLLIETDMPDCLLELCAHVAGYRPVIRRWELNEFPRYTSFVSYPGDLLLDYARRSYQSLKAEQGKLIGQQTRRRSRG